MLSPDIGDPWFKNGSPIMTGNRHKTPTGMVGKIEMLQTTPPLIKCVGDSMVNCKCLQAQFERTDRPLDFLDFSKSR